MKTWSFDHLELAKSSVYYVVYSTDAVAGSVANRTTAYDSNVYSGGALIYNSSLTPSLDANFSATLATSAIPEPTTYATFAGLAALGSAALRRRRRKI